MNRSVHLTYYFLCMLLMSLFAKAELQQQDTTQLEHPRSKPVNQNGDFGVNPIKEYNESYYIVSRINENIGLPPNEYNFRTPQATLEHFMLSARDSDFAAASYALNFNRMPLSLNKEEAAILAEKLYFVINQRVAIDWGSISDRPDGQIDIQTSTNKAIAGEPRRSVYFGEVDLEGRDASLRLQRIKHKDYGAFWLISADTVENIDEMYAIYGPRKLDRMMPEWARFAIWGIPLWKLLGTIILIFLAWGIGALGAVLVRKACQATDLVWLNVIAKNFSRPAGFTIGVLFFYISLNTLISFSGTLATWLYSFLLIVVIISITWLVSKFIDSFMIYVAENRIGDTNPEENSEARQMLTYVSVARRVVTFVVISIGIGIIISQFKSLERLGISLLASAGILTVVMGIAAQSTLGNIIAGLQIAITSPAKIGDTVIIKDDWGYVEDIKFTYMVVRTWDERRLVVPLKYVISNIFENWSMTNAHQVRPIIVHADYRIDVEKVRDHFHTILKDNELWDGEHDPVVQVVEAGEKTIQIRALCSGKDASTTWALHCELREQLVAFIADLEKGLYLAKTRIEVREKNQSIEQLE